MIPRYRVWVEAEETMHPVLGLNWSGVGDDLTAFVPIGKTLLRDVSIDGDVLMQSTGLFDKNGVEIFEGDVLRCTSTDGSKWIEKVYWDKELAGFATRQTGYDGTALNYITDSKAISVEVVGDVYQLEVTDDQ